MLNAMAGGDINDHSSSSEPVPDYTASIGSLSSPPRIGVVRSFFFERCDEEVKSRTLDAIERLAKAGALVEDIDLSFDFDTVLSAQGVLMNVEGAAVHQRNFSL